ncbi:hypothetical protein PSQ20_04555 [Curvibacter sp. RS43]|uniref:hypothetical protein n=1 Tax=Curvibacter microcysteis TaxID=3026419 RepID=UPI00235FCBF7|nr:hypothetical protein [Curvibacter sp. RS43]MDD0809596.1 hypothetical protein [Curvibacter sp. RS43]
MVMLRAFFLADLSFYWTLLVCASAPAVTVLGLLLRERWIFRNNLQSLHAETLPWPLATSLDKQAHVLNRGGLELRLAQRVGRADQEGRSCCVICLTVGGAGAASLVARSELPPELMQPVVARLRDLLPADADLACVDRGKWYLLLPGDVSTGLALARRMNQELSLPFQLGKGAIRLNCALGLAVHPEHGMGSGLLLKAAIATHRVSFQGGGFGLYRHPLAPPLMSGAHRGAGRSEPHCITGESTHAHLDDSQ